MREGSRGYWLALSFTPASLEALRRSLPERQPTKRDWRLMAKKKAQAHRSPTRCPFPAPTETLSTITGPSCPTAARRPALWLFKRLTSLAVRSVQEAIA